MQTRKVNGYIITAITDGTGNNTAYYTIDRASDNVRLVHWWVKGYHPPKQLLDIVERTVIPNMQGTYPKYLYNP